MDRISSFAWERKHEECEDGREVREEREGKEGVMEEVEKWIK